MTHARYGALVVGSTATAAIIMAMLFKAPPIPVTIGAAAAAAWLLFRRR